MDGGFQKKGIQIVKYSCGGYKNGDVVAWFESAKAAEEVTGVKRANICKVLKGERRYAGGYEWGYAACGGELEVNNR